MRDLLTEEEAMNLDFQAAKDLYYLTCEMHAELWRLGRMAPAYSRVEILQLKNGEVSRPGGGGVGLSEPVIARGGEILAEQVGGKGRGPLRRGPRRCWQAGTPTRPSGCGTCSPAPGS